jgi:CPA1 family monovalent cation:H+ antiporter
VHWNLIRFEIMLLTAALVAMLMRRLRLPYTVGLVIAGAALAFSSLGIGLRLTKEQIFFGFLPPLVFEASLAIRWDELRRDLAVTAVLATAGVIIAAALTAAGMHYFIGWAWSAALLFGVLIAATDPVAVIAAFKEAGIHGRLRLLVEGESLFNDGTAAVLFSATLAAILGGTTEPPGVAGSFLIAVLGGICCGALVGLMALALAGRSDDPLVITTLTTVAAYGGFLLAEQFHTSGVLATMTAGLVMGNVGRRLHFSDKVREAVVAFWEYIDFLANSLIFLLMGARLARQDFARLEVPCLAAIVLVLLGRAASVYGCCGLFARSRLRVTWPHQHVLVWGGLRGALAMALTLGLPPELPGRQAITAVVFAVVGFSVIVQGLTMKPLLRSLGQLPGAPRKGAESGDRHRSEP